MAYNTVIVGRVTDKETGKVIHKHIFYEGNGWGVKLSDFGIIVDQEKGTLYHKDYDEVWAVTSHDNGRALGYSLGMVSTQ